MEDKTAVQKKLSKPPRGAWLVGGRDPIETPSTCYSSPTYELQVTGCASHPPATKPLLTWKVNASPQQMPLA